MIGKNIFIEFNIIQKSNLKTLVQELDQLIARKNNIYLWSKTLTPSQMRLYCLSNKIDINDKTTFQKVLELRRQKKSFTEISQLTGVPLEQISFFLTTDPNKTWTLDDFIKDYLVKDSSIYAKADFVIDSDPKFVHRFQLKGLDGHCIEKI